MAEFIIDLSGVEVKTIKEAHGIETIEALWGLPVRERIVRCRDCAYFFEYATLHDEDCPHFCSLHGIDMAETDDFCAWGERKEVDA